jgi:hypothetical protein
MRGFLTLTAIALSGLCVYALPGLAEWALLEERLSPWIACVALGDLAGCVILFILGFRKTALAIYLSAGAIEGVMLSMHTVSPLRLVWFTNLIPALVVAAILVKAALRNLVLEEY